MALNIIPEARPQEAQTTPDDLRLGLNLAEFRSGLRHVIGSSLIGLTAGAATAGLLFLSWKTGSSSEAAFFVGFAAFSAFTTYWTIAYCRAAGDELFNRYKIAAVCASQANRENATLRKQNLRLVREQSQRAAAGADGDAGENPSPSASNIRLIPHNGRVN